MHSKYGVWESKDGGTSWTLLKEAKTELNGATDLEIDPQNPNILYALVLGRRDLQEHRRRRALGTDHDRPPGDADYSGTGRRGSRSGSRIRPAQTAVLYAGFDWTTGGPAFQRSGSRRTAAPAGRSCRPAPGADTVEDYCGKQCSYDNVIDADPTNPNIVFAAGQFNYGIGSGGIFRSDDGGQTWKNLGWDLHPDFHAIAFDPANPAHVMIGNDGGVWYSADRGGRPNAERPAQRGRLAEPQRHGRSEHGRR